LCCIAHDLSRCFKGDLKLSLRLPYLSLFYNAIPRRGGACLHKGRTPAPLFPNRSLDCNWGGRFLTPKKPFNEEQNPLILSRGR
jgi:hypothetical protein